MAPLFMSPLRHDGLQPSMPSSHVYKYTKRRPQAGQSLSLGAFRLPLSTLLLTLLLSAASLSASSLDPRSSHSSSLHHLFTSSLVLSQSKSTETLLEDAYNTYHVDQGLAEEVEAVPHDAYIGYEVLRLTFSSSPTSDVSLSSDIEQKAPHIEPRFRLLAESDSDNNLVSIFASDSEDLERHAYEVVDEFNDGESLTDSSDHQPSFSTMSPLPKWHFALLSDGMLMTTRDLSDLVNKPVFLAVREDASPYYVRDRVFRINVYNNTRLSKVRFNQPSAMGHLLENSPAGTLVEGIETLRLIDGEKVVNDGSVVFALIEHLSEHRQEHSHLHERSVQRRHSPHHLQQKSSEPLRLVNSTTIAILSNQPLDRELKPFYDFILSARSLDNNFFAQIPLRVHIDDVNDNAATFERALYEFYIAHDTPLYSLIGNVTATDADQLDSVVYHLTERNPNFVIVPKTGQLMLIKHSPHVPHRFEFEVFATDDRPLSERRSSQPVPVIVEVYREETYDEDANEDTATDNAESSSSRSSSSTSSQSEEQNSPNSISNEEAENFRDMEMYSVEEHHGSEAVVARARAKREIRLTKTYEFKESDGATQGMVVFQLDKQSPQETFRLEHPNKWVMVDPSGAVKVKEIWDYEQLGKDKTIDFWVECILNGKFSTLLAAIIYEFAIYYLY